MSNLNVFTVSDDEGDFFWQVQAQPRQGTMIFTIRKHDKETGELLTSEAHFENRYYPKFDLAERYISND